MWQPYCFHINRLYSMKKLLIIAIVLFSSLCSAQNSEGMYCFVDYPISTIDIQLKGDLGVNLYVRSYMDTFVRKVDTGNTTQYFYVLKVYQVPINDIHSSLIPICVTMISDDDLIKMNNGLNELLVEEDALWKGGFSQIDYVEKKYVSTNGLEIGFCVDKGRLEWFVESDYYGIINGWNLKERVLNNKAFSINSGSFLEDSFSKALAKINGLKGQ